MMLRILRETRRLKGRHRNLTTWSPLATAFNSASTKDDFQFNLPKKSTVSSISYE